MFGTLLGIKPQAHSSHGPLDPFWYEMLGQRAQTGQMVTADSALRVSTVYACVRVLAETLAQLPCFVYERLEEGKRPAPEHNLFDVLHGLPNGWQTPFEFTEMGQGHLALRGNFYAQIMAGSRGAVSELLPLHPARMKVERLENGRLRYYHTPENGRERPFNQDEIFHVRGLSVDGLVGLNPISASAKERIGIAQATDEYTGAFFKNQAQPGGILKSVNRLTPDSRRDNKKSWQEANTGGNRFQVAVLDGGLEWQSMGLSNKDSELLGLRQYSDNDIARLFRVPPHMVGILDKATYSNIEQQSLEFVMYTMMPWIRRWEGAINRDLVDDRARYFAEFQVNSLLRGDVKSRYESYAIGIQNGWLCVNDIRRLENMNPVEGGDVYLSPLNMIPATDRGGTPPAGATAASPAPEASREWVKTFAMDAAERIAKAEHRELEKRAKHAATDRERFDEWAGKFYDDHAGYAEKAIAPLWSACGKADGALVAKQIAQAGCMTIQAGDPVVVLEGWPSQREQQIYQLILRSAE